MRVTPPFHKTFAIYSRMEKPVFYTPSHYVISMIVLTIALSPLYTLATAYWGWKIIYLLGFSIVTGFILEALSYHITRQYTGYMGLATWLLFPLMTTPGMDNLLSILCFLGAIIIAQIFFGGYGRQMFHPAVVAQVFLMNNFISRFSSSILRPFIEPGFGFYMYSSTAHTKDTLIELLKSGKEFGLMEMLQGPHSGFYSDAFPLILIVCGIIFLLIGGVNRKTPVSFLISLGVTGELLRYLIPGTTFSFDYYLLAGSSLFYAFFIFSDRWTSAKSQGGRIIAGITAGILTVLIRNFSTNSGAVMYAALFTYAFIPLYDELGFYMKKKFGKNRQPNK
ncbi:MAG: RnfABCDGE type electron transport complex subunit D [Spirochaetales bacterium]|nr:RnfABCDGE type electron transport complex subunit D [Spirochaetales bacterium]